MNYTQAQIWYRQAVLHARKGDNFKARRAYAIALRYDPALPPLPQFHNHSLLQTLEKACLVMVVLLCAFIIYLLCWRPAVPVNTEFPWWTVNARGESTSPGDESLKPLTGLNAEAENVTLPTFREALAFKPLTLLRNALYLYTLDHGRFPGELQALVKEQYLETIPGDMEMGLSSVTDIFTGEGGWVYTPPGATSPAQAVEQVAKALYPNYGKLWQRPFAPLTLQVNLAESSITLLEGNFPLKTWPAAIGAPDSPTPAGDWRIVAKNVLSHGRANPYGSRWMRLGKEFPFVGSASTDLLAQRGIGIHGTTDVYALGTAVTNGCVRMLNRDIEELYEIIPNGVMIKVVNE